MSGSVYGKIFKVATFGESHGVALGAVVDGCPPGVPLSAEIIQADLDKRRPGQSDMTTARSEPDKVEVLSGLFEGATTGTPLGLLVRNKDHDSSAYDKLKDLVRPGHGDLTYHLKYGTRDHRGGGRASGRETVARVAAGAVARAVLKAEGIEVHAYTIEVGGLKAAKRDLAEAERNSLRCPDKEAFGRMEALVKKVAADKDSVGGIVEVVASGVPAGLGEPVFDKLDAEIAKALMSIGGVKGVELGDGFAVASRRGSENSDPVTMDNGIPATRNNRAGGVLAGISTGENLIARIAVKPTSSIGMDQDTLGLDGKPRTVNIGGRHDPCLCPRIVPVAEAMLCLTLCDALLLQRAACGKTGPIGRIG